MNGHQYCDECGAAVMPYTLTTRLENAPWDSAHGRSISLRVCRRCVREAAIAESLGDLLKLLRKDDSA